MLCRNQLPSVNWTSQHKIPAHKTTWRVCEHASHVVFKRMQYFQMPMAMLLTVLQCCMSPWSTLRPSMTMRPAIMAFVVAIAGMMLPAIAEKQISSSLNYWQTYIVLNIILHGYDTFVHNSIACMYSHLTSKRDFNGMPKI